MMSKRQTRVPVAFRLGRTTVDGLKRRARSSGVAQTALAERYIDEGLRMDEHPRIHFREGELGRRPALLGMRLDVAGVVETIRQNDGSIDATAGYLEVPVEQIDACARYYADYRDEVDALIARAADAAQRELELAQRAREALA